MNILFLDDNDLRIQATENKFCEVQPSDSISSLTCVTTAEDTINKLQDGTKWDFISLDHDLGGNTFMDSNREDTGMEVVRWITRNMKAKEYDGVIRVHSWNVPAGKRMTETLKMYGFKCYYEPFNV